MECTSAILRGPARAAQRAARGGVDLAPLHPLESSASTRRRADAANRRDPESGGQTRHDPGGLVKRAAALGLVASATSLGPLTEAALARSQAKRGGTFRIAVSGGSTDFIDGQHIVAKSDIARLMAGWDTLAYFDEQLPDPPRPGRGAHGREGQPVPHPRQGRDRVPQRQDARRSTTSSTRSAAPRTRS